MLFLYFFSCLYDFISANKQHTSLWLFLNGTTWLSNVLFHTLFQGKERVNYQNKTQFSCISWLPLDNTIDICGTPWGSEARKSEEKGRKWCLKSATHWLHISGIITQRVVMQVTRKQRKQGNRCNWEIIVNSWKALLLFNPQKRLGTETKSLSSLSCCHP